MILPNKDITEIETFLANKDVGGKIKMNHLVSDSPGPAGFLIWFDWKKNNERIETFTGKFLDFNNCFDEKIKLFIEKLVSSKEYLNR